MKVLVIVARGLQAGALGCYGNRWARTPALDSLAATGALFDQHFADQPDAEGARRAWRTGCYSFAPLPTASPPPFPRPDLLAALTERGAWAQLIVDASRGSPAAFEVGWSAVARIVPGEEERGLEATLEAAGAALAELAERDDWLLWVDLGTLLLPWDVPDNFLEAETVVPAEEGPAEEGEEEAPEEEPLVPLTEVAEDLIPSEDDALYLGIQAGYAAAVSYLDAGVEQLLEAVAELGEVVVIFTSDHGQALGEHGVVGAVRPWLHNEVVQVPLLVRFPGEAEEGLRVHALTQSIDLAPTLAELFGCSLPAAHGHSLLPLLRGGHGPERPYACSGLQVGGEGEWALRTPEWAFLLPYPSAGEANSRGPALYVKPDDRYEVNNVVQHQLERAEELEKALRAFVDATARPGPG